MSLTAARRVEPLSPAVSVGPADQSNHYFTPAKARAVTDEIRHHLGAGILGLQLAREGHAHLALGYDTWHSYLLAEFGDLRELRLPAAERRAIVASMCGAGMSVRAIRKAIGFSVGTIQGDRAALGYGPAQVDLEPEPDPYRGLSPRWEALARVAAQADRGLTREELDAETTNPEGTVGSALSKLAARSWVTKGSFDDRRRNQRPYRITEAGRAKLAAVLADRDAAEGG